MKPSIQTLGQILYAQSQYVIPVFQRSYRWERPQWEKLWASLIEIRRPEKTGNHFMGFLVFVPGHAQPGKLTRFHLIDGQQRLTTCSILLAALRNTARRAGDTALADEVHEDFLVHPRRKGEERYRLLPKEADFHHYAEMLEGGESAGRIGEALEFFEQQSATLAEETGGLRSMFDLVCQRLEFMYATLETENAYNIFKSLNSTGVPLGQSDLIRNFVFMHVAPDDQDAFEKSRWRALEARFTGAGGRLDEDAFSGFFRNYLMSDGRYVQPNETFATFEARFEATRFSPDALADSLLQAARDYAVITGAEADTDPAVTAALAGLNVLESSTTWPLLLALFRLRREGRLDSAGLARCVAMLRGFILRRFVCGDSSRGYGQMFVRALARDLSDPVATLENYLLERGWPDDRRFVDAFVLFPLYRRGYAREVLEALERARGHKEQADLSKVQIEHVMPQTLTPAWEAELGADAARVHAEWLHRPGNLTLSAYNQEMSNQPFAVKRKRFDASNVVLTRQLGKRERWSEDVIRERGTQLAEAAVALWTGPSEPYVAVARPGRTGDMAPAESVRLQFWSGLADHLAERHPDLPSFEPRRFSTIRLNSGVRHIGFDLRVQVRPGGVFIDVYFWRTASFPVWERLRADPAEIERAIGDKWLFDRSPKIDRGWMTVGVAADLDNESSWPQLHAWFGERLEQLYREVAPRLRDEMGEAESDEEQSNGAVGEGAESATRRLQLAFWTALVDDLAQHAPYIGPQKPRAQHWQRIKIGRAGFGLIPSVSVREERLGVEIYMGGPAAKERFDQLLSLRGEIEAALGFPMEWQRLPEAEASRIAVYRSGSPLQDESRWTEYLTWLRERVIEMDAVFRPRIRALP
jgi:hypothetical protein